VSRRRILRLRLSETTFWAVSYFLMLVVLFGAGFFLQGLAKHAVDRVLDGQTRTDDLGCASAGPSPSPSPEVEPTPNRPAEGELPHSPTRLTPQQLRVQGAFLAWLGCIYAYAALSIGAAVFSWRSIFNFLSMCRREALTFDPRRVRKRPKRLRARLSLHIARVRRPFLGSSLLVVGALSLGFLFDQVGAWRAFLGSSLRTLLSERLAGPEQWTVCKIVHFHNAVRDAVLMLLILFACQSFVHFERFRRRLPLDLYRDPHARILEMQARRNTYLLYSGSILLVVGMIQIILFVNLIIEFYSGLNFVDRETFRRGLETYPFAVGLFLSVILFTTYAFGTMSVTSQVKSLVRTLDLGPDETEQFLKLHGLQDSFLYGMTRILALLGPTLVGVLGTYLLRLLQGE
jgi:hypothetical protein